MSIFNIIRNSLTALFFYFIAIISVNATHIRAGEITVERVSCQSREFLITITGYVDLESIVKFGGGELDFGDGSDKISRLMDEAELVHSQDFNDLVGIRVFQIRHTYGANGSYRITYFEHNRNANIINMDNSVNTPFFIETIINIDPFLGCNNTPVLEIPPIDRGCVGVTYFHNPGAFDEDGDSLSYEIVIPWQDDSIRVGNYRFPNDPSFGGTKEDGSLPTDFEFDRKTGDIIWDAPGEPGEYNIAFIVSEWRRIGERVFFMGFVRRDMQIIIEACENDRPEIELPPDICVEAGTVIDENILGTDPDGDPVILEAFSGIFDFTSSPPTLDPDPATTDPDDLVQPSPGVINFRWETNCFHVREQPYQVRFKVSDVPEEGPTLVGFGTWNIKIVGPAPTGVDAQVTSGSTIDLSWDPYTCGNAEFMQIWRRVDSFDFPQDSCLTGIPQNSGYELIRQLDDVNTTSLVDDNDLAPGATYCYRLVAVFPFPAGGKSYASVEVCATIGADAPVITHATIDTTSPTDGEVTVSWKPPFEVDQTQFPPPYNYKVLRASGFSGNQNLTEVASTTDTTITDTGIDTRDKVYNYRVVLFDANGTMVDTSAVASTVRLSPTPMFRRIQLSWTADVPWSINPQDWPYHYIWRDQVDPGDPSKLVLIDSVNVNQDGLKYLDEGQITGEPLEDTQTYCYYVTTFGSYGNPQIEAPQINLSQIICTQPSDTIAPCTPVFKLKKTDCETFIATQPCSYNVFSNELFWEKNSDPECDDDIKEYIIYFSFTGEEGSFEELDRTSELFYEHKNLPSFAGCYRISAIDRSGNESPLSEPQCNDNCPNYVVPNVFTPNGDGHNDEFRAFSDVIIPGEDGSTEDHDHGGSIDYTKCPRFVEQLDFRVYNRWGKEIFTYTSGGENSIYINWDGRTNEGNQISAGTYYYVAEVTFDLLDKTNNVRKIKGWIHVMK